MNFNYKCYLLTLVAVAVLTVYVSFTDADTIADGSIPESPEDGSIPESPEDGFITELPEDMQVLAIGDHLSNTINEIKSELSTAWDNFMTSVSFAWTQVRNSFQRLNELSEDE
ncbi:hypothetical protein EWB00_003849, partial [Schistosoma japonicum]